jgi:hypothetical protein
VIAVNVSGRRRRRQRINRAQSRQRFNNNIHKYTHTHARARHVHVAATVATLSEILYGAAVTIYNNMVTYPISSGLKTSPSDDPRVCVVRAREKGRKCVGPGRREGGEGYVHARGGDCIRPFGKREIRFSDP